MWIDTHCHLDAGEFDGDRAALVAAAAAAGVGDIVVPAVATASFAAVRTCCRQAVSPRCHAAYGIHPLYVPAAHDEDLAILRHWLRDEPAVAVGEIGLDAFVRDVDPEAQRRFFVDQLRIAREFDLPVLLHVRRAQDAVLRELRRIRVRGGIAHAFNGSPQQAGQFIDLGFALGFGGAMTYARATRIRDLARCLPLSAIVLETDAPDMPPAFCADRRNLPQHLPRIAETLAELRGMAVEAVAAATAENARRVLALPGA